MGFLCWNLKFEARILLIISLPYSQKRDRYFFALRQSETSTELSVSGCDCCGAVMDRRALVVDVAVAGWLNADGAGDRFGPPFRPRAKKNKIHEKLKSRHKSGSHFNSPLSIPAPWSCVRRLVAGRSLANRSPALSLLFHAHVRITGFGSFFGEGGRRGNRGLSSVLACRRISFL